MSIGPCAPRPVATILGPTTETIHPKQNLLRLLTPTLWPTQMDQRPPSPAYSRPNLVEKKQCPRPCSCRGPRCCTCNEGSAGEGGSTRGAQGGATLSHKPGSSTPFAPENTRIVLYYPCNHFIMRVQRLATTNATH